MKAATLFTESVTETSKFAAYDFLNTNRNSFDALSEIGIICGVFLVILGLFSALMTSFFGAPPHLYNVGVMLIFFSLILLMNGVGNRYKTAGDKEADR